MTNVAGMDYKEWGSGQGVDLRDCLLQRGSYIFVRFFVETWIMHTLGLPRSGRAWLMSSRIV